MRLRRRRALLTTVLTGALVALTAPVLAAAPGAGGPDRSGDPGGWCTPTGASRVVCPARGPADTASFIDPSADIRGARHVGLGQLVYVAPFARIDASRTSPVSIGARSNVEDQTLLDASPDSTPARDAAVRSLGISESTGITIAPQTVFGHHTSVLGPAVIGVGGGDIAVNAGDPLVILNQGAQVDGAWLEQNTAVSVMARVGPGVRLRSGMQVLPGKNVTTQAEADDPALGKVTPLTEADIAGTELSIDANTGFAREYARLYRDRRTAVRGIGPDPGGTPYSGVRSVPEVATDSGTCDGVPTLLPGFRSRIIGSVCLEDDVARLQQVVGRGVSLRADEGTDTPYLVGAIGHMHDGVVFHDVPEAGIVTGDRVVYGEDSTVHSGPGRPAVVGDDAVLGAGSVVFGSNIGAGSQLGERSLVGFTDLPPAPSYRPAASCSADSSSAPWSGDAPPAGSPADAAVGSDTAQSRGARGPSRHRRHLGTDLPGRSDGGRSRPSGDTVRVRRVRERRGLPRRRGSRVLDEHLAACLAPHRRRGGVHGLRRRSGGRGLPTDDHHHRAADHPQRRRRDDDRRCPPHPARRPAGLPRHPARCHGGRRVPRRHREHPQRRLPGRDHPPPEP
jgi:carbonic anhydrase/acetyltransferase-like protein (isoleucine patch superfamily)